MIALFMAGVSLSGVAAAELYDKRAKKNEFQERLQRICTRANRLPHTKVFKDDDRAAIADKLLSAVTSDGTYTLKDKKVEVKWLDVSVSATATFKPLSNFLSSDDIEVSASYTCRGIPPYPRDKTTLVSSLFSNRQGEELTLPKLRGRRKDPSKGCWGVFKNSDLDWSWNESRKYSRNSNRLITDANGDPVDAQVEVQFWGEDAVCWRGGPKLPSWSKSDYVIELDAYSNNEIIQQVTLHPGHYRVEMNYWGRHSAISIDNNGLYSNAIGVWLESVRPARQFSSKRVVLAQGPRKDYWQRFTYDFTVPEYAIYRISIKSEGRSDSVGGLFNDFRLVYLNDFQGASANAAQ